MKPSSLDARLREAKARRLSLFSDPATTAFRLVNAEGDALPDVTVDWFDGVAITSLYREHSPAEEEALLDGVAKVFGARAVYLKRRPREARVVANTRKDQLAPETAARGESVEQLDIRERGLHFRIRPGQGLSVGLYLDMREGRAWVQRHASGRSVLNLFAYTCGFGVAAMAGGATRALNVDLSRRVLDWGAENTALNGFTSGPRDFLAGDVFDWARRLAKRQEQFELVVLDPPSFSTSKEGRFSAAKDYSRLVAQTAPLVSSGGTLLACCNLSTLTPERFAAQVKEGAAEAGRRAKVVEQLGAPELDFPDEPGSIPALKVCAVELL